MNSLRVKGEPEVKSVWGLISWIRRLFGLKTSPEDQKQAHARPKMSWIKRLFGMSHPEEDSATDEFATLSSFTLMPGQLKLKVGVVSVRGNYREHNEDNFFVPGRRSVRHDSGTESHAEMPALTMESSNLFIVADGMGGQQAGEQASLMAVDLIPRAIQKRLTAEEGEPGASRKRFVTQSPR